MVQGLACKSGGLEVGGSNPPKPIIAVILLAGMSRRLANGKQKLLEPYRGRPLMLWALSAVLELFDCIALTGYQHERVENCIEKYLEKNKSIQHSIKLVHNPLYETGQLSSCFRALEEVPLNNDFTFILGDMPNITAEFVEQIYASFLSRGNNYNVLRPIIDSTPSHPIFFDSSLREVLLSHKGDGNFKKINDILKADSRFKVKDLKLPPSPLSKDVDYLSDFE